MASGKVIEDAFGDSDVFGECAVAPVVPAGDADDLAVVAEVDFAAPAESARPAIDGGIEGDTVAGLELCYAGACRGDQAGSFMAHDDGWNAAAGGAVVAVDIAAADAAGGNADQDFAGTRFGLGEIGKFELQILFQEQGFHEISR